MPIYRWKEQNYEVKAGAQAPEVDGKELSLKLHQSSENSYLLESAQAPARRLSYLKRGQTVQVWYGGEFYELTRFNRPQSESALNSNQISAPLTGKVIQVSVEVGQSVSAGEVLVILESMKMETNLVAPFDGQVQELHCSAGEQVHNGQVLIELEA